MLNAKTEDEILKGIAYYMLEANVDLISSFQEFDWLLDDHNLEKATRLKVQMQTTRLNLATAIENVDSLIEVYCGI